MIRFYVDPLSSSQILVEPFTSEHNGKALLFNGGISCSVLERVLDANATGCLF